MTSLPLARTVADEVWALLSTITNVTRYDGDVADEPPKRPDGGVHAYFVFYPSPGRGFGDRLSGRANKLAWSCQVTCVGADRTDLMWCVDKVRAALIGRSVSIGRIREIGGNESLFPSIDYDVSPHRRYVSLDFGIHVAG